MDLERIVVPRLLARSRALLTAYYSMWTEKNRWTHSQRLGPRVTIEDVYAQLTGQDRESVMLRELKTVLQQLITTIRGQRGKRGEETHLIATTMKIVEGNVTKSTLEAAMLAISDAID